MNRIGLLLIGTLSIATLGIAQAQDALPTQPTNARAVFYNGAGGEVFWDRASDDRGVVGYELKLNNVVLGVFDALSYYDATLVPTQSYQFSITSIDSAQQRSASSLVSLGVTSAPTLAPHSDTPTNMPEPPAGLTSKRYSKTSAELFWTRSTNPELKYEILLPGGRTATTDGVSYFSNKLGADQVEVNVVAIDPQGNRSEARSVVIPAFGKSMPQDVQDAPSVADVPSVPKAGPDIYLLLGQSNMVGRGNDVDAVALAQGLDATDVRISQLNVDENLVYNTGSLDNFLRTFTPLSPEHFVLADDPLHEPFEPTRQGKSGIEIGLGVSFAKAALADNGRNVVLVPAAYSGTGFCNNAQKVGWNVDNGVNPAFANNWLYLRAVQRANIAIEETGGVLKGILWHQGESDSQSVECAENYQANLQQLVQALRTNIAQDARGAAFRGPNAPIPFVAGTMSRGADARGNFSVFNAAKTQVDSAHRTISTYLSSAGFVNNDDLVPPAYPCGAQSCIHFGSVALREMGYRYYQEVKRLAK